MPNTLSDLHISSTTANISDVFDPQTNFQIISPNAAPATVAAAEIASDIQSRALVMVTTDGSPNSSEAGDIVVDSGNPVSWQTDPRGTLRLDAAGSIAFNASMSGNSIFQIAANSGAISESG